MPGGRDALKYAEDTLGVHSTHKAAEVASLEAERLRRNLALERRVKADMEERYRDAELEFLSNERGEHSDLSQTAWEKLAKELVHKDPALRKARAQLADKSLELEASEAAVRKAQTDVDIAVARLHELGGYLAYLAAIKQASLLPVTWPGVSTV